MKNFIYKHWLKIIGIVLGAVAGYLYYYYVGCLTGSCPLTSNPWRMTIYGAIMGYLFLDIFKKEQPSKSKETKKINHN